MCVLLHYLKVALMPFYVSACQTELEQAIWDRTRLWRGEEWRGKFFWPTQMRPNSFRAEPRQEFKQEKVRH